MTKFIVLGHQVHTFRNQFPAQAWFEAPLGAEPFAVSKIDEGLAILAVSPIGAPDVQYPIIILPPGVGNDLPIGTRPGAFIGMAMLQGDDGRPGQALVFRSEPWPQSREQASAMHRISMPSEGEA